MFKKLFFGFCVLGLVFAVTVCAEEIVRGQIDSIAEDGSYIVVNGTKILTSSEAVKASFFEVGDQVEITTSSTDDGLVADNYRYVTEEELSGNVSPTEESNVSEYSLPETTPEEEYPVVPQENSQVTDEM